MVGVARASPRLSGRAGARARSIVRRAGTRVHAGRHRHRSDRVRRASRVGVVATRRGSGAEGRRRADRRRRRASAPHFRRSRDGAVRLLPRTAGGRRASHSKLRAAACDRSRIPHRERDFARDEPSCPDLSAGQQRAGVLRTTARARPTASRGDGSGCLDRSAAVDSRAPILHDRDAARGVCEPSARHCARLGSWTVLPGPRHSHPDGRWATTTPRRPNR